MGLSRRGNVLWVAMVLGGVTLGVYVLLAWPEASSRLVRLPYGEAMPKSVRVAAEQAEATVAAPATEQVRVPAAAPVPEPEPELAVASPKGTYEGPSPVGSDDDYVESAEELGAEPLPGFGPEPAPAPAAESDETSTAAPASDEPDDEEPALDVVIELPQPPSAAE